MMIIKFDDFSNEVQRVAHQSQNIAIRYQQDLIDLEHIFLALIEVPDNETQGLFSSNQSEIVRRVTSIVFKLPTGNRPVTEASNFFIDERVKQVIELAQLEANRFSAKEIRPIHLLSAVIQMYTGPERRSACGRVISEFKITKEKVRNIILKKIKQNSYFHFMD